MKRPALYILIFTLAGIFAGLYFTTVYMPFIFAAAVIIAVTAIILYYKNFIFCLLIPMSLIAFYFAVNAGLYTNSQLESVADTSYPVEINATVKDIVKLYDDTTKYSITIDSFTYNYVQYSSNVNMYIYTDTDLNIGDVINFKSTILHGNIKRNDSDFDEIRYFKIKNIEYKAYADNVKIVGHKNTIYVILNKISLKTENILYKIYPEKEAGLITAMLLGSRANLDTEIYDLFQNAGIVHIIAISGLHISILAGILLYFTKNMGYYISKIITAVFLLFYCIITGGSVSVIRAVIMMYIYILSELIGRKYDLLSSASVACCIILCFNPYYIFDLGFQYSFTAVFTIGLVSELLNKHNVTNKFIILFIISIAVSVTTKPITVYNFYYINLIDFILNIVVISLIQFIIVFGITSLILGSLILKLGIFIGGFSYVLLKIIENLSQLSLKLPLSHIETGCIAIKYIFIIYIFIFSVYILCMKKLIAVPCIIICLTVGLFEINSSYKGFEADFIYVGQGDCTLITDSNRCYLVDCGSSLYKKYGQTILSQLKYNNIDKIDGIYISHFDYDHMGAVTEIAEYIPINCIYISKYSYHNENYNLLVNTANKNNIRIQNIDENYEEKLTDNMLIKTVYLNSSPLNTNESSAIYKVIYKDKSILFTGDINNTVEEDILKKADVKANIIKVPHHGSYGSVSLPFIKAVNPEIAVNFAGYNNIYNHPSVKTLDTYKNMNIPFFSTDYNGIVKIRIYDNDIYYKLLNTQFKPISELKH